MTPDTKEERSVQTPRNAAQSPPSITPAPAIQPAQLSVVGLGPGDAALLAPMARQAMEEAAVLVGYRTYLELVPEELTQGKTVVSTGMRQEMERAAAAVEHALAGRATAVVSSGDAGVYGMAGLILEFLEKKDLLDTLPCRVVPGIPALCAAAALLGAPLMHDFACVSLSDLLTPRELIRRRVEAAAAADFVIVLYNPRSRRRTDQLPEALEIVARHRGPDTPVGLVQRAFRPGQRVQVQPLADFAPGEVDMTSIVVIGNSYSRAAGQRMLTPRGYFDKYALPEEG